MKGSTKYQPIIKLKIVAERKQKVQNASVTLDWAGGSKSGATKPKLTKRSGSVNIKLPKFQLADIVTLSMNDISKDEYVYHGAKNVLYDDCRLFSTECPVVTIRKPEEDN